MKTETKKQLMIILVLTIISSLGAYFLAKTVDKTVSDVTVIKSDIEQYTRIALEQESKASEYDKVGEYRAQIDKKLPDISDLVDILKQIEVMGDIADTDVTIKLEEGVLGEDEVEFEESEEKKAFLDSLNVQELEKDPLDATEQEDGENVNVAVQMMQQDQSSQKEESDLKVSYLNVDITLRGKYSEVKNYIELMQGCEYLFSIKEMKIDKRNEGQVDANLKVRVFIFDLK